MSAQDVLPREHTQRYSRSSIDAATHAGFHHAVRDAAVRATTAVGLGGIAIIHAVDGVGKWSETRYIFWMYMALIVAAIATAACVLISPAPRWLLAAAGLAATVLLAFCVSRTVGLPNATDDIGNWTEPLGLASLFVEGFVVAVAAGGYAAAERHRR
jgi:Na+/melibiose symporter-like transporter